MSAHYSDLTDTAPADRQNVAAGMQLAPKGQPNVLRFDHLNDPKTLADAPYLPDWATFGPVDPTHIGPNLPNLGQGELIDMDYAMSDGGCTSNEGTDCIATELGFALDVAPSDPMNLLSHRRMRNVIDLQMALNNENVEGVEGDGGSNFPATGNPGDVETGIEISIPLSEIGMPNGDFRVVAFVNGSGHDFLSNQFIGTGPLEGNLASPAFVDLDFIPGDQFVTIMNASTVDGDFDDNGLYECADVDALVAEIVGGSNNAAFDLNGDTVVDATDLTLWLAEAGENNLGPGRAYLGGDANLDGVVDGSDFIIWNDNKFTLTSAWCSGDFNADGATDGGDFIVWNDNKFQSSDSVNAVPEPATALFGMLAAIGLAFFRRR